MQTTDFDYELPEAAIAQEPVEPRDTARLLVTSDMSDHLFSDLPAFLGPDDLLVVNDTRVRAARLHMTKEATGGVVEVLLLERLDETTWTAMARPARRLHPGTRLVAGNLTGEVLTDPEAGVVTLALRADGDVEELVRRQGEVPLPPYITTPLDDPDRYQTVYAQIPASAA
ncbi:MAG TPA: S-adenosylmethionine:tRNA ribosyltransferase-isomerase, partial [Acidimicrobiia bacterium]|nr:S-adenosylmethionine:tRNA ribosyltransferase-isomerase [Acidimicrobiia bacterium]